MGLITRLHATPQPLRTTAVFPGRYPGYFFTTCFRGQKNVVHVRFEFGLTYLCFVMRLSALPFLDPCTVTFEVRDAMVYYSLRRTMCLVAATAA